MWHSQVQVLCPHTMAVPPTHVGLGLGCAPLRQKLATSTPQSLVELAQLVRGKLDLVSQHGNRTLCVRLCLTHLDQVDGYSGFSRLLRSRNHTSRVDPTGGELQITDLDGALVPFDAHLALALTSCTPDEFPDLRGG